MTVLLVDLNAIVKEKLSIFILYHYKLISYEYVYACLQSLLIRLNSKINRQNGSN